MPGLNGLTLAFGFSGHGFKLAPAMGLVLAHRVLGQASDVGIGPYGLSRVAEGRPLTGATGLGSISEHPLGLGKVKTWSMDFLAQSSSPDSSS